MRKHLSLPALGLSFVCLNGPSARGNDLDVTAYRIEMTLQEQQTLEVVTLVATADASLAQLDLELASSVELRSCKLGDREVPFVRNGWDLALDLAAAGSPRGEIQLTFELDGRPYNKQSGGQVRTTIAAENAYVRHQYAWYPRRRSDPATYETRITARGDWLVRSAGRLQEKRPDGDALTWVYVESNPVVEIGFAAGPYVHVAAPSGAGVDLDAFVHAGHEEGAAALLEVASRAIELYGDLFGPMEAQQFSLVEMPAAFGAASGYGEVGYALIGSAAFENAGDAPWAAELIAHEVAHTWWGREVAFSNFANEMLATYSVLRYIEHSSGLDAAQAERQRLARRVAKIASERRLISLADIEGWSAGDSTVYSACAYDKSAMLLHGLEQTMGRKAFDRALRAFFEEHRGTIVDYSDVGKALAGSRYRWFIEQWEQAEVPALRLEHEVSGSGSRVQVQGTLFQEDVARPYRMTVILRARAGEQTHDHEVKLKKAATKFRFTCPFEPAEIVVDPDAHWVKAVPGLEDLEAIKQAIFAVANSPNEGDPARLRKTIQNIRKVIAAGQESASVYHTALGRCAFRLGDNELARDEFQAALEGGAGGPFHRTWVHLRLGCIADMKGDRKAARAYYQKVLDAAESSNHDYQKSLAQRFAEKGYRSYRQDS